MRAAFDAAIEHSRPIQYCVPHENVARDFERIAKEINSATNAKKVLLESLCKVQTIETLYIPGPSIKRFASLRLRTSPDAFSIAGITHTVASHGAMTSISEMTESALMPWDALICTSEAVKGTVVKIIQSKLDFLRWRFKLSEPPPMPQLAVIPLGVHCKDFEFSEQQRQSARQRINVADDDVVILNVGRLSFHAKAHPFPMYAGAEIVANKTKKRITLLMCGWFANDAIRNAFVDGAQQFFPSGRTLFIDGGNPEKNKTAWASADIFVSLSDNVQESFGLTPIEAMATGLPSLVTDWDGYKDTVRHGIDGFRIQVNTGLQANSEMLATNYEAGSISYDAYCGLSCMTVAASIHDFSNYLELLVMNPALRKTMGAAAKKRDYEVYDWPVIFSRYENLFANLNDARKRGGSDLDRKNLSEMRVYPDKLSPQFLFGDYGSANVFCYDIIKITDEKADGLISRYLEMARHPLFSFASGILPSADLCEVVFKADGISIADAANQAEIAEDQLSSACSILLKMGLISIVAKSVNSA